MKAARGMKLRKEGWGSSRILDHESHESTRMGRGCQEQARGVADRRIHRAANEVG
jgi:hypothetical protein